MVLQYFIMTFDIESGANGRLSYDQVAELQRLAGEAEIEANVNPSALSEEQHEQVRALRVQAREAVLAANAETVYLRPQV